jgi:acyl-CoA thioester hydrolase
MARLRVMMRRYKIIACNHLLTTFDALKDAKMSQEKELYRHRALIQVRFKDVDQMGHVNNANHFTYFELARVKYFNEVVNEPIEWKEQGIILAHMEIDYKRPILLNDEVYVYSRVSKFGTKSFEVEYKIVVVVNGNEDIAATGKSVQVCFDYTRNETMNVPETWKQKVIAYEPGLQAL